METLAGPLLFVVFFAVMFGVGLFSRQRRRNLWREFAQRHGGTFFESKGWFSTTDDYISLTLEGFEVRLDHYVVSHGKSSTTYQRATISAWSYADFTAQIYKETPLFSKIGKAFGGQDIKVGHPEFDDAFIIKSDSPTLLIQNLDQDAVQEHLRQRHMRMELDGLAITVVRVGLIYNQDAMLAQLRLAALYARGFFGEPKQLEHQLDEVQAAPPGAAW